MLLDDAVQATCTAHDVAMVGLLEGAYTRPDRPVPDHYRRPGTDAALRVLSEVASGLGVDAGQAVLAWLAHRAAPVIPVVGVSRPEQLDSAITGVTTALPDDAVAALEDAHRRAR